MIGIDDATPIACSLNAPEVAERELEWQQLLARALVSRRVVLGGLRLELRALPGVGAELDRLLAAERACCPFLTLDVIRSEGSLLLTGTAPAFAAPILEQLFPERCQ